jgi:hypothetical protein
MAYSEWLYIGAIINGRVIKYINYEHKRVGYILKNEPDDVDLLYCSIGTMHKHILLKSKARKTLCKRRGDYVSKMRAESDTKSRTIIIKLNK